MKRGSTKTTHHSQNNAFFIISIRSFHGISSLWVWASPQDFKMRLLGEGFHILINGVLFSSPTNVGYHNPPPFGLSVLANTLSFFQLTWDRHQIHPPLGSASSLALFLLPIHVGLPSNPPPFGLSILAGTLSFIPSMWDRHQIRTSQSTPLRAQCPR